MVVGDAARSSSSPSARRSRASARVAALVPDDQLAEQRIVERRHRVAGIEHACRSARPVPPGTRERRDRARARARSSCAGSSALMRHFDRVAGEARCRPGGCAERSPPAMRIISRTRSMPVTISVTGMLDLDAGVHLDEVELAGSPRRRDIRACRRRGSRPPCASATARRAERLARRPASGEAAGASSQTFWRRRCSEHSRSKQMDDVARRRRAPAPRCAARASMKRSRDRARRRRTRRCASALRLRHAGARDSVGVVARRGCRARRRRPPP